MSALNYSLFYKFGFPSGPHRGPEGRGCGGAAPTAILHSALEPIGRPTAPQFNCFQIRRTDKSRDHFSKDGRIHQERHVN